MLVFFKFCLGAKFGPEKTFFLRFENIIFNNLQKHFRGGMFCYWVLGTRVCVCVCVCVLRGRIVLKTEKKFLA